MLDVSSETGFQTVAELFDQKPDDFNTREISHPVILEISNDIPTNIENGIDGGAGGLEKPRPGWVRGRYARCSVSSARTCFLENVVLRVVVVENVVLRGSFRAITVVRRGTWLGPKTCPPRNAHRVGGGEIVGLQHPQSHLAHLGLRGEPGRTSRIHNVSREAMGGAGDLGLQTQLKRSCNTKTDRAAGEDLKTDEHVDERQLQMRRNNIFIF